MNFIQIKCIKVISNGVIIFSPDNYSSEKQFKITEKDYKNYFLFKKKKNTSFKKFDSLSNYKNQYIF